MVKRSVWKVVQADTTEIASNRNPNINVKYILDEIDKDSVEKAPI